jgi:hypothetical protein
MDSQKYSINQQKVETLLSWIQADEIAVPEIQRPFVWKGSKVRDLIDSLYNGFPIGYLILWRNPDVILKNGNKSLGKKILIDGQQRITALNASVLGEQVVNENYQKKNIRIAFHPHEEKFEVTNPAIEKNASWLADISKIINGGLAYLNEIATTYAEKNEISKSVVLENLDKLRNIKNTHIGLIELDAGLDIETVTEIFIRINSQGVVLSQADFVMSKIASNEAYEGSTLRKAIDYFCHLAVAPEFYSSIKENDEEFSKTKYFSQIKWLETETDDLYDPGYTDLIRVAFTTQFERGKLSDLVSLLSGRNFRERTFEEEIAKESFAKLSVGISNFINETNFKRFLMILNSAGFIRASMVRSMNAIDFAYVVYLKLKELGVDASKIESYVRRWYVMSVLTGRYSGSPESRFDADIKDIAAEPIDELLMTIEKSELSDAFWEVGLVDSLQSSVASSPYFKVFTAAQVKRGDRGFLSKDIKVKDLVSHRGDIHHLYPKEFLKKSGLSRKRYNQIANYAYTQSEINIKIGKKSPEKYFEELQKQLNGGSPKYGGINNEKDLLKNLRENAIPKSIIDGKLDNYDEFLIERQKLIANKIKKYYFSL